MSEQVTPAGSATAAPAAQPNATTQPAGTPPAAAPAPAAPAATPAVAAAPEPPKADPAAPAAGGAPDPGAKAPEPKKEEEKSPAEKQIEKPAVPDKYELKLPDGSKLGKVDVAKVESLAREKGWSQEKAQEVLNDRHAFRSEMEQQQSQTIKDLNEKTWKEQLMADPEVGGQKFEQSGHLAYKAVERFGGKEFADQLKAMNLNHQPELFKMLVNIGKAMESDKFVTNNPSAAGGKVPPEARMYPEMFKKKE